MRNIKYKEKDRIWKFFIFYRNSYIYKRLQGYSHSIEISPEKFIIFNATLKYKLDRLKKGEIISVLEIDLNKNTIKYKFNTTKVIAGVAIHAEKSEEVSIKWPWHIKILRMFIK